MARIIKNKHYKNVADITGDKFDETHGLSEIIISNEKGAEGIYIKNTEGEVVNISNTNGSTNFKQYFLTVDEYEELISNGEVIVNNEKITYNDNTYYAVYEPIDNQEE